jgi:putative peptide zinc metalloprotease protein
MSPLCPDCRRFAGSDPERCSACGRSPAGVAEPLELVLADGRRVALVETITIGRAPRNVIPLTDPSVSREHARIRAAEGDGGLVLEDVGSAFGTWLDGERVQRPVALDDGATIRLGDTRLTVERRRDAAQAGRTIVLGGAHSLVMPVLDGAAPGPGPGPRPRVRGGVALKRLEAGEGEQRWVLRDAEGASALRLGETEAGLVGLLDGTRGVAELIGEAEARVGARGAAVLARLLADLGEHGFLEGVDAPEAQAARGLRRLLAPRVIELAGAGDVFDRVYRRGGWRLFTRAGLATIAAIAIAGLVALALVIAGDRATPFVVGGHLGLGGVIFIVGRLAVVLAHELAHGLTLIAFGRRAQRAGVKFILGFPYAFVDTSAALFEPRRRRLAISASGPISDLAVGGACALACLAVPVAGVREVSLQVALAAYTGALFNLNPLLDRDGYHMLVDWMGIPNLRRRARDWLAAGGRRGPGTAVIARYALATIAWSLLTAAFVVVLTLRYRERLRDVAPDGVVWVLLASLWLLVALPAAVAIARPLLGRRRARVEAAG